MKYHLCVKENDKNLLHIITDKDLKKPLYKAYTSLATSHSESDAQKAVMRLFEDFCNVYWDKGESPDFVEFSAWVREVFA